MKLAAVVIDSHKLEVFRRHLSAAGYSFTEHPGPTTDTLTLKVKFEWAADLAPIIQAANNECARRKLQ